MLKSVVTVQPISSFVAVSMKFLSSTDNACDSTAGAVSDFENLKHLFSHDAVHKVTCQRVPDLETSSNIISFSQVIRDG